MQYVHLPTIIDAYHVGNEHWPKWVIKAVKDGWISPVAGEAMEIHVSHELWDLALPGDYIVREDECNFYTMGAKAFHDRYEPLL